MERTRPRALVTAPVRGPGLELLRQIADLVVDPWIDHEPLRIYNAEQLAGARRRGEGDGTHRRGRPLCRAGVRAPAGGRGEHPGRPQQRRRPCRHRRRHPRAARPGPQRRRRGRADRRPAAGGHPRGARRRRRRARRGGLQERHHPLPALPGVAAGGTHRRPRGTGCRGPRPALASGRPRDARGGLRPLRRGRHPQPRAAPGRVRRGVDARAGDPRDDGHDRRRRSSPPCETGSCS